MTKYPITSKTFDGMPAPSYDSACFMKVLITGGAGFIGSHLAERLLERGDEVVALDDLSTGRRENLAHLESNPKLKVVIGKVEDETVSTTLISDADVIFHLAAAVGVRLVVEHPVRTIETNIRGTEVVLRLAAEKKTRVLVASTSEVYGKREQVPFREDDDLILGSTSKSRWSYACSKAIDEFLALAYWKERQLPVVVVRLFNTVGPRQTGRYGMVIPNFVRQAIKGEAITVYGAGTQTRCFTHVADVVSALIALIQRPESSGQVYNVGSSRELTIKELAERVKELTGSSSEIKLIPYEEAYEEGFEDMLRRVPDISKLSTLTGYAPTRSLEDIIIDVVNEQRAHPEA